MIFALSVLVLALMWTAMTGTFTLANLVLGAVIGFVALWIMRNRIAGPFLFVRLRRIVALALLFFYELTMSALRVAILVLRPNLNAHLKPGIIAFPLTVKTDPEITLLANLITLTPGTLSVDVSNDRRYLYIHALAVPDKLALIDDIAGGFEAKIIEVFE